jgi:hypothetical protein
MATTVANTACVNNIEPAKIKVVNTIPDLCDTEMGEMYLLISDSATDDKKIHIRVATGWLKTSALS